MRKLLRADSGLVPLWLTMLVAFVLALRTHPPMRTVFEAFLVLAPLLAAIAYNWSLRRSRRRLVQVTDEAAARAESATVEHGRALGEVRETMAAGVNAAIVEIVAAQQAVVRAAHPDDVLLRLTAAEDRAHTVLQDLGNSPRMTSAQLGAD